jgi:hypothetical protein
MPREIQMADYETFIGAWIMDDLSICDELIAFHKGNKEAKLGSVIKEGKPTVLKEHKDSVDSRLMFHYPVTQRYLNELDRILNLYGQKYPSCTMGAPVRAEAVNVQEYFPGGGFHMWHCERLGPGWPENSRHLVYMTYLNDVTDGGETEWLHQKLKVKPQKGLTVIWPTDWTHAHRGITSPTQFKYIVTGWYQYFDSSSPTRPF